VGEIPNTYNRRHPTGTRKNTSTFFLKFCICCIASHSCCLRAGRFVRPISKESVLLRIRLISYDAPIPFSEIAIREMPCHKGRANLYHFITTLHGFKGES
jgi:hypothetical protein